MRWMLAAFCTIHAKHLSICVPRQAAGAFFRRKAKQRIS
jgi:hypothetical protein